LKQALLPAAFAACCVPLPWLAFQFFTGGLGANPIEALLNDLGYTAFVLLALTLACTPAQVLLGWKWPIRIRKLLGDFCFFYACLHLGTYVVLDQGVALRFILADVAKRPFITAGVTAFLLMFPLAATSTRGAIRRLGRRWQVLHRLVYISAAAAALHFIWKVKVVAGEPIYYGVALILLLTFRVLRKAQAESAVRRQPAQA